MHVLKGYFWYFMDLRQSEVSNKIKFLLLPLSSFEEESL